MPSNTQISSASESPEAWWISLNITRTRITLLGFNLSVIAFLISVMLAAHQDQAFTHHVPAMGSLFVAFVLSIVSATCLLMSQELDEHGASRPWLFSIGDILMYLALSQSVAGLCRKYLGAVAAAVEYTQEGYAAAQGTGDVLIFILAGLGLLAWALTFYLGPCLSILKSPLKRQERLLLTGFYFVMVAVIILVAIEGHLLQDAVLDDPEPLWRVVLTQFAQPLTW